MILCGQHSLEIFCLGILLSFIGHFVTSEVSRSVGMQILISMLGICCHGGSCVADHMVQHYRGARFRESSETAAGGPRRRRGMRRFAGALIGILAYMSAAPAGPGDACLVAAHLVQADAALPRVAAAIKAKTLTIVVAGTGSSTLPGASGPDAGLSGAPRSGAAEEVAGRERQGYIARQVAPDRCRHGGDVPQGSARTKSPRSWSGRPAPSMRCAASRRKDSRRRSKRRSASCMRAART